MRVNSRVFSERIDMLDNIRIPNCPSQFKLIAENILNMATKPGYSVPDYNTMTQLDKFLMLQYWTEFDGLHNSDDTFLLNFNDWFIHKATPPELIRRAIQFLSSHNYIIIKPDVQERAIEAGIKFSKAVKG